VTFNVAQGNLPSDVVSEQTHVYGSTIQQLPVPTRAGYTFAGWRLNNDIVTAPLTVTANMSLYASWTPGATASPSPAPSSSPSPSSSPAPSSTPRPSPTPAPCPEGKRPNPQTNPLNISFAIFGAVMLTGIAAFGITTITKKHKAQANQYGKDLARHNREERIADMLDKK